jgi:hypothetical protein
MIVLTLSPATMALAQENAQRVSDYIAYRHFIFAASSRDDASDAERHRRETFIARIGLSSSDDASLRAALRSVRERLDDLAAERLALRAATPPLAQATGINQREKAVFDGATARLRAFLSKDGWQRLDQFVREELKPTIAVRTDRSR